MPSDNEKPLRSLNPETGMLEDIDEVRQAGLDLADLILFLVQHPLVRMLLPPGMIFDVVAVAANHRAYFTKTSQAQLMRSIGAAFRANPLETELQIRLHGLSEELPITHPDAAKMPPLPPMSQDNPLVQGSVFLPDMLRQQEERQKQEQEQQKPPEHVELPADLEEFLKSLSDRTYKPEGD